MKFILMTVALCLLAFAIVSAVPVSDTGYEVLYDSADNYNPQDPQSFFKLKKLKKLLFLG